MLSYARHREASRAIRSMAWPGLCWLVAVLLGAFPAAATADEKPWILTPNGGEEWPAATTQVITWAPNASTVGDVVRVDLYRYGDKVLGIDGSAPNNGYFSWHIPAGFATGGGYRVWVYPEGNWAAWDASDFEFSIVAPPSPLQVVSPEASTAWARGLEHRIEWTSDAEAVGDEVNVNLYRDGTFLEQIAFRTPNDGLHTWSVPDGQDIGGGYTIGVKSSAFPESIHATSHGEFEILAERPLQVLTPNGGEAWARGWTHRIEWTADGSTGGQVGIDLLLAGECVAVLTDGTPNDGAFDWALPASLTLGGAYSVEVRPLSNEEDADRSSIAFAIVDEAIRATDPNGGETVSQGDPMRIGWETLDEELIGDEVKLALYRYGAYVATISGPTENDGEFTWIVPTDLPPGDGYAINIRGGLNAAIRDSSDGTFTVSAVRAMNHEVSINEFMAKNDTGLLDMDGDTSDWIELYNLAPYAVSLEGCQITDRRGWSAAWTFPRVLIPGNGYLLLFASGKNWPNTIGELHTHFCIDDEGEYLALRNAAGLQTTAFSPAYPPQAPDLSYGLGTGMPPLFTYFRDPTPGSANSEGEGYYGVVTPVQIMVRTNTFTIPATAYLWTDTPDCLIRYTTDGSTPSDTHGTLYDNGVSIESPSLLQAVAYRVGYASAYLEPTPFYDGAVAPPKFSRDRGYHGGPFELTIESPTPGAQVLYTTDGSEPGPATAHYYSGPIPIEDSTVLRACAWKALMMPSPTVTHTFVLDANARLRALPVLSISGDPEEAIYSPNGVLAIVGGHHVLDDDGKLKWRPEKWDQGRWVYDPEAYNHPMSRGRAFERPVSAELIHASGVPGFQIDCGLRVHGSSATSPKYQPVEHTTPWTEQRKKYSLRLYFREEYGTDRLVYPFLPDSAVQSLDRFVIRAGVYDWIDPFIRDEFLRRTLVACQQLASRGTFVNLFLNGRHKGYFNPVEHYRTDFYESWYGDHHGEWDIIGSHEAKEGDRDTWQALVWYAKDNDLTNPQRYALFAEWMDLVNLADYMIVQLWAGNNDWFGSNWYAARPRGGTEEKFRHYSWDNEGTLGGAAGGGNNTGRFFFDELNSWNDDICYFYRALKPTAGFRAIFNARLGRHFLMEGGALTKPVLSERFSQLRDTVEPAMDGPMDVSILTKWIPQRESRFLAACAEEGFFADSQESLHRPGDVIITEFLACPKSGEKNEEWIELYNTTNAPIDINGWALADNDTDHHVIQASGPLLIAPGGYLVLGRHENPLVNGGVAVDYSYRKDVTLGNDGDEIVLLENDFVIHSVGYGDYHPAHFPVFTATGFPAMQCRSLGMDGNYTHGPISSWAYQGRLFGTGGNKGTPGSANSATEPGAFWIVR